MRPAVVILIDRGELARPVIAKAEALELRAKGVHRFLCRDGWMHAGLDCVLLGWQTKRVEPHWVKDVESLVSFESADDIGGGVSLGMSDVESGAGGVGKHVDAVVLGLGSVEALLTGVWRRECAVAIPQ